MVHGWRIVLVSGFCCVLGLSVRAQQTPPPACLHGPVETVDQRARRLEASRAAAAIEAFNFRPVTYGRRQTYSGEPLRPLGPPERVATPVPEWWWAANDVARDYAGPLRDTIRRMAWGSTEPVPGWRIAWRIEDGWYRFTLIDTLDPCGFSIGPDAVADGVAPPSGPPAIIG
jgi:hypothetical protein